MNCKASTIVVIWKEPADIVTGYRITCQPKGDGKRRETKPGTTMVTYISPRHSCVIHSSVASFLLPQLVQKYLQICSTCSNMHNIFGVNYGIMLIRIYKLLHLAILVELANVLHNKSEIKPTYYLTGSK